ncbi:MAG: cohesin domain-containing protein, partial [Clostridium sp.]
MKSLKKTLNKKISKVLLSLLALSIVVPTGITTSAATVVQPTVNFTVTGELKAGNIVDVAVNVNNATDLYAASLDFTFDKDFIEVQSVTPGSVFPANVNVPVAKLKTVPGTIETAMTLIGAEKAVATTGTVATMKLKLLKDGKVTLKANNSDAALTAAGVNIRLKLSNSAAASIAYTATDKEIVVGNVTPIENVKIATFVADKASSQAINSTITFTATATPATGTTYEF